MKVFQNHNISFYLLFLFLGSTAMTCSNKRTTDRDGKDMTGLVEKVESQKVMIYGGDPATLDNNKLQSRFYLVRHAEKQTDGKDPDLLPEGVERANRLAEIMKKVPLRRIFSTNYRRTQRTAAPVAADMHLQVINYDTKEFQGIFEHLLSQVGNGNYLFVGHSNSIPFMLNHLTGKEVYHNIPENVYEKFFVVSVYEDKRVNVLELKY